MLERLPSAAACLLALGTACGAAEAAVYQDRASFDAALAAAGLNPAGDGFESDAPGALADGAALGPFIISFDAATTQPAVVPDGAGGQALGGAPFDVLVGGDSFTLTIGAPAGLLAFGADFAFAPNGGDLPAALYTLTSAGAQSASPAALAAAGGSFFLGIVEDGAARFGSVTLAAADGSALGVLTPAWQVDNLVWAAAAVPETPTLRLLLAGLVMGGALVRRRLATTRRNDDNH